ncbi:MAG: enolase C-terminal domain-like protein [Alloprevotella sp.]
MFFSLPSLPPFSVRVVPRTLVFKQPAGTSRGVYTERRVWYIIIYGTHEGRRFTGVGECAPLFDLSSDYTTHYEAQLQDAARQVQERGGAALAALRGKPSMLFGFETAMLSAAASLRGDYRRLFDTPFTHGGAGITINGLVWMGRHEEMLARMEEKLEKGFTCVKLKIGAIDFEAELDLIRRLRARFSQECVTLRVDANGAFAPQEALPKLEQLSRYGIHSIEQPIRAGQWQEMARLCRQTPLPIALDEELIGVNLREEKENLLDEIRPQFIVLKPTLHGGLSGAAEWMDAALRRDVGFWVTSALESNVGLNALAQWVAHLQPQLPPRLAALPQGLGTGQLFVENYSDINLCIEGERLFYGTAEQRAFCQELNEFAAEWHNPCPTLRVHTSGSTGTPKEIVVEKDRMRASALATCRFLGLHAGQTALLCLPLRYIAGKMLAVRAFECGLHLVPVAPCANPLKHLHEAPHFAAMTPMQVYECLQLPHSRSLLRRIKCLIIGGGAVSKELEGDLRTFPNGIWSTYGMTETLSHIALRRLSGKEAATAYTALPGVHIATAPDGRLRIDAPAICPTPLTTNDIAEILPDGSFKILGRTDNIICSGGLKFQLEALEEKLAPLPVPFLLTAIPDARLGQALALIYEGADADTALLLRLCRERLARHEQPRHILRAARLPRTETGKPARKEAARLAEQLAAKN